MKQAENDSIKQNLILEEFRYWNAKRNNISEPFLAEIMENILKLKFELRSTT